MSPSSASGSASRVAVVGAGTASGEHVRAALAESGVHGSRVDLFGSTRGEAVLSEYDGEARLIQEPVPSEVANHDVIFLCEGGEASSRILALARPDSLVLDLEGCSADGPQTIVHTEIRPMAERAGIVTVPHPIGVVLAEMLHPIDRALGVRRAMAVVLRPAADFGERGLAELRDQTLGLFRFSSPPVDVFGRQLAFNVIPEATLDAGSHLESKLADEVARLLGWTEARLAVSLVTVPVFHGHGISMRVELAAPSTPGDLASAFERGPRIEAGSESAISTPIEASGGRKTTVSRVCSDGMGGFWIWAVAGEAGSAAAEQAVRLASGAGAL